MVFVGKLVWLYPNHALGLVKDTTHQNPCLFQEICTLAKAAHVVVWAWLPGSKMFFSGFQSCLQPGVLSGVRHALCLHSLSFNVVCWLVLVFEFFFFCSPFLPDCIWVHMDYTETLSLKQDNMPELCDGLTVGLWCLSSSSVLFRRRKQLRVSAPSSGRMVTAEEILFSIWLFLYQLSLFFSCIKSFGSLQELLLLIF